MMENNYVCPYCGKAISQEDVLFWETVKTQYTDNIRGDFLKRHGVRVAAGNRFPRMYYRAAPEKITRVDENGFPTMIEDHLGNAIAPEELSRNNSGLEDAFDDDFDAEGFESDMERRTERRDRELHLIPKRACPFCHCELPQQFGMLKTYHVAMFGGRAAGKTAYLVNLFQQLKTQLSSNDLGTADLAAESSAFLQPMIDDYEREGTTHPTPADGGLMPIVCHYKNKGNEAFITFYDIAGEGTGDPAYMANHKGIANCETLMLMIDPNMFVSGAFYDEWNANHFKGVDRYNDAGDCCKEPLDSFLYQAGELCKEYSDGIKNVVCVITKIDMMLEKDSKFFGSGDIELLNDVGEKHREAVNLGILKRVNDDLNVYLERQHKIRLKEKLTYIFGEETRINLLGVSTSTRDRESGQKIRFEPRSSAIDPKHRIIEPFLVVLMYFGLVPARNGRGEIVYYQGKEIPDPGQMPALDNDQKEQEDKKEKKKKKRGLFGWGRK